MCSGNGYEEVREPTHAYIKHRLYTKAALPSTEDFII